MKCYRDGSNCSEKQCTYGYNSDKTHNTDQKRPEERPRVLKRQTFRNR